MPTFLHAVGVVLYEICCSLVHTPSHVLPKLGPPTGSSTPTHSRHVLGYYPERVATLPLGSHRWCWGVALEPHDLSYEDCNVYPLTALP